MGCLLFAFPKLLAKLLHILQNAQQSNMWLAKFSITIEHWSKKRMCGIRAQQIYPLRNVPWPFSDKWKGFNSKRSISLTLRF